MTAKFHQRTFWSRCISPRISGGCGYWQLCNEQQHPAHPQISWGLPSASAGDWCWGRQQNLARSVVLWLDKTEFPARPAGPLLGSHSTRDTRALRRWHTHTMSPQVNKEKWTLKTAWSENTDRGKTVSDEGVEQYLCRSPVSAPSQGTLDRLDSTCFLPSRHLDDTFASSEVSVIRTQLLHFSTQRASWFLDTWMQKKWGFEKLEDLSLKASSAISVGTSQRKTE